MQRPTVNGRYYPLWQQFVDRKEEWIGGKLTDFGDACDLEPATTEIVDIALKPNGKKSAMLEVVGNAFNCASDVGYLGVDSDMIVPDGIGFSGYGGHRWSIAKPTK